jgi:predicted MFS family arabinose efflux permease
MAMHTLSTVSGGADDYLIGRRAAWFAFVMTFALMLVDYIDRQVIVSLFPYIKTEWGLSDKQLGGLVSVVSVTVALGALPIALLADRTSRVKSIVVMATVWSLATISCMFARNYSVLFTARAFVGLGEAGYGSVGAALIASLFPARLRARLLAAFFAAASVGSVLGVLLGGMIAARWGWQAAFGVVGVPGLVLALVYLKVRDYKTVALTPTLERATDTTTSTVKFVAQALVRSPTMLWVCLGGAAQLIVVSAVWAWLPSFLNRVHGIAPDKAGVQAALVVLCGAVGSVVWGAVVDRAGTRRLRNKLFAMAALCVAAAAVLAPSLAATASFGTQFALIALGGFMMTCTVGPVSAVVADVVHPGVRATGLSVLALFQNLFGLAAGPFLTGVLSDVYGLQAALAIVPAFGVLAAVFFLLAARSYEADVHRVERIELQTERAEPGKRPALA